MKITAIRLFQTDLPYRDPEGYAWGAGNVIKVARATPWSRFRPMRA